MSNKPPEKDTIPVRNADIKIRVLDTQEIEETIFCNAQVDEVNGYGASTPPLSVGQIIRIHFPLSIIEEGEITKGRQLNIRASWNNASRKANNSEHESIEYWSFEFFNEN